MTDPTTVTLRDLAFARSGHKDSIANIAVCAFNEPAYRFLEEHLTVRAVKNYFKLLGYKSVERYNVDNLLTLNFVIKGLLSSTTKRMLYLDNQGRALGQALLELTLEAPPHILNYTQGAS